MKRLFAFLLITIATALAGCSGVQVDSAAVTDCMVQCLNENIQVTLEDGTVINVTPNDFKEAVWNSEKQTLELRGYKLGKLKVGGK